MTTTLNIMSAVATEFNLTEAHLTLIRAMCWEWNRCETGAPSCNPKRPYGNSNVGQDIASLLSWYWPDEDAMSARAFDERSDIAERRSMAIHSETQTALEVISCRAGQASPAGRYVNTARAYRRPCWELRPSPHPGT